MAIEKLERQLGLLAALLHTSRPLRAAEIQRQVEGYPDEGVAFRRAFERDKDDLRRLGIPLTVERTETPDGSVDGYRVRQNDYYLHDLGLEPDEVVALSVALRLIRMEGTGVDDALWKLGGREGAIEHAPELAAISIGPLVTQAHEAISARAVVTFEYRGATRRVEPWRLAFRRGHWYLNGYDTDRGDSRSFRFDRVEGSLTVGAANSAVVPRSDGNGNRQPWQFTTDDDQNYRARILVNASHARWAQHHLVDADLVATREDGSIELEIDVTNVVGFRTLMLSLLDAAIVLEPAELRDDIISWLEQLL